MQRTIITFTRRGPLAVAVTLFVSLHFGGLQAWAITKVWVAGADNWNTSTNWLPTSKPSSPDDADISNGGTAILSSSTFGNFGTPRNAYLGSAIGTSGHIDIITGGRLIPTFVSVGEVGTGTIDVDGAGSRVSTNMIQVGNFGVGTVNVTNGGLLDGFGAADVAAQVDSTGTVRVTGTGSRWNSTSVSAGTDIGQAGTAYVYIENGGHWQSGTTRIGTLAGEGTHGTVFVDAATWNSNAITIGVAGRGTLTVQNAAVFDSTTGIIADVAGSIGDVTVTGQNSLWTPSLLTVAKSGVGTLNIWAGGRVAADIAIDVGDALNSIGIANVDGTDGSTPSKLTTTGALNVGDAGNGTLNITGGALVEVNNNADAFIGNAATAEGIVNVTGGGTLKLTDELLVGWFGKGTLNLNTGGSIQNVNFRPVSIGRFEDSIGIVNVGEGSAWNDTAMLTIGDSGRGEFHLTGGGDAQTHNVSIGNFGLAEGIATVGPGSTWTASGTFYVGESAEGTLQIEGGGLLQTGSPQIGAHSGSAGTVIVTGQSASDQPSRWISTSNLEVGSSGAGNLRVLAGAYVESADGEVGAASGGHGLVEVVGQGSLWKNNGALRVGSFGSGEMNVRDGGVVQSTNGHVGYFGDADSLVTIEGKDIDDNPSSWINSGGLTVGDLSNGKLDILEGGYVQSVNGIVGYDTAVTAFVEVNGAGSLWRNTGTLRIGYSGDGSLDIRDGGTVESADTTLGYDAGSSGLGIVTRNSTWKIAGALTVGGDGTGDMRIAGTVESLDAVIGDSDEGQVILDDTGEDVGDATWKITGELHVGSSSTGDLFIRLGGVENTNAILGRFPGSLGRADIYRGAAWKNSGELHVGRSGTGIVNVGEIGLLTEIGATLENTNGFIGRFNGSNGTVNVSKDATWTNSGNLTVGGTGTGVGMLDLKDGGHVTVGVAMTVTANGTVQGTGRIDAPLITNNGKIILGADQITYDDTIPAPGDYSQYKANLLIVGDFTQQAGGRIEVNGLNSTHTRYSPATGTHNTGMLVTGTATLNGNLSVAFESGYVPDVGDRFAILSANEIAGRIANFESADVLDRDDRFLGLNYRSTTDGDEPVLEVITLAAPRRIHGSANSPNLLLVTHGTRDNANPAEWVGQLAEAMSVAPHAGDWEVVTLDWQPYNGGGTDVFANDFQPGGDTFDPLGASNNAINIGDSLMRWYRAQERSFGSVHLMAHSAGTWLVDAMADDLFLNGGAENIHLTLFEAFVPPTGIGNIEGTDAEMADHVDFAEHYYHSNYLPPFTNGVYEQAVNGDLAQFHPIPESEYVASHAYPYVWYTGTAGDPLNPGHRGLGIQLSRINSGIAPNWEAGNTAFSSGDVILLTADDAANVTIDYTSIDFDEQTNVITGDVEIDDDSAILTTHSPAILTSLLDLDDPFSAISFDMEFLSDIPGLLSVYLGSEQIFGFENEFYAAGPGDLMNSGLIWLSEEMPAGPYSLTFRIDPLGPGDASIEISNLQFITLTEVITNLPGDFNVDGSVDAADYVMWRKLGLSPEQYTAWRGNFGAGSNGAGGDANSLVLEPSALLLVLLSIPALVSRRHAA